VIVLDELGKIMEKGNWYEYAPTAESKVLVEALDLAGNVVKTEKEPKSGVQRLAITNGLSRPDIPERK
jgi:hypothetical protein